MVESVDQMITTTSWPVNFGYLFRRGGGGGCNINLNIAFANKNKDENLSDYDLSPKKGAGLDYFRILYDSNITNQ